MFKPKSTDNGWTIIAPDGSILPTVYKTHSDAQRFAKELNHNSAWLSIPEFLNLCCELTTQRLVAATLNTQGHVVGGWISQRVQCRRKPEDFHRLAKVVSDYYGAYPPIRDYILSIKVGEPCGSNIGTRPFAKNWRGLKKKSRQNHSIR